ncbi:hypothetical protein SARC_00542 [Sphaeroforma arctica JP610]|uniref:Uncharacterized protein n=1 Tax=Sphaeroforma arctica JP610 TaxID=667725 RepID=A0A0L0GE98_9EUKA|nr:hypothetical protein SARC_00542 [Sphaeroforma arctica JP610]KNC87352.1 hypothetical protein SARC_00542 [Sphaeroforma arctica JP610]|eukprot:XP_014161254.1 hypothetical protein SARC_00542 [Sphaeroforma arctica JP610]
MTLPLFFEKLLIRTPGLLAVVLTDRDGVILEQVRTGLPDTALTPGMLSALSITSEQAGKLGCGRNKRAAALYSDFQVVHFNLLPLIVSLFATSDANTGVLLDLEDEIKAVVSQFESVTNLQG